MDRIKQTSFKKDDIISAFEIGQYHFCPMAWYLQRCGYAPKSESLKIGRDKHVELGNMLCYTQKNIKKSRILAYFGYLLLFIALIILFFGVVL